MQNSYVASIVALFHNAMKLLAVLSMVGSVLTFLLGIANLIYGWTKLNYAPSHCEFYYCNSNWRSLVSLAPDVFMDTFQPIILGLIGIMYSMPVGVRPSQPMFLSPPSSTWLGGVFHIIQAMFANLGYMFWLGMAFAAYNIIIGLIIIIYRSLENGNRNGSRPKDADEVTAERRENQTTDGIEPENVAQPV